MENIRLTLQDLLKNKKILVTTAAALLLFVAACVVYQGKQNGGAEEILLTEEDPGAPPEESVQSEASGSENPATIIVDVSGAVNNPSVVFLPEGGRVYEAITSAGGPRDDADLRDINRAAELRDGDKLYIPTKEEGEITASLPASAGRAEKYGDANGLININTADSQELQKLNGVGPATADKIIAYRTENGAFKAVGDIKNVSGIGEKTFEKFKDMISV